ncbi:MAG TPA: hypothetical protein VFS67_36370 [Polyangiaceae bacterium]|nr:hypothetical protein [Polyangiaceae bacterium]
MTLDAARIFFDAHEPAVAFAAEEIGGALRARGYTVEHGSLEQFFARPAPGASWSILLLEREEAARRGVPIGARTRELRAEGFAVEVDGGAVLRVIGSDVGGQLYGGLELAEQIRAFGVEGVTPLARSPQHALRGTKFNLPLDARTPSYSDMSDSAQAAIPAVWDFEFWRSYLDGLARHRYNLLSLWNEHPFPSLVRVPEYPEVALADVWRSQARFEEHYPTIGTDLVSPTLLERVEVVARLTIEQKIEFWRRVMRHARDRNIELCLVTWNIFTYGVGGKYGINDAIDNPITVDYFRASVRALFRTYPLLRGIGLTTGENMGQASFEAKEAWAFASYGQGTLDAARAEPGRRFRFIHRQHQARVDEIAESFQPLLEQANVDFVFSFKYAQAHVLSATRQTFHDQFWSSLGRFEALWTLRNDDALMFRWAAPDFVREFVRNLPSERAAGYYFGSDMWIWAREFLDLEPSSPRQLELDKHWLHFLLWGRLGYDPGLDNERIVALVAQRFGGIDAQRLLDAWQQASLIYPLVTGFHWGEFDFQWYIEGCCSRPGPAQTASGFHDLERFITLGVHPGTDNVSIPDYVAAVTSGEAIEGSTPPQIADRIAAHSAAALAGVERLSDPELLARDSELRKTLGDIRAMALLGRYYADKIRGASELALFRATAAGAHQQRAVEALRAAARSWRAYTAQASAQYRNPLWTNRVGRVDWVKLTQEVDRDVAIASDALPAPRQ